MQKTIENLIKQEKLCLQMTNKFQQLIRPW